MLSNFFSGGLSASLARHSHWLRTRGVGVLVAGAAFLVPQVASAQILPTFRNGNDRFVELRASIQRGYRSASSARYNLYVVNPKVTSKRLIITEVTDLFAKQGGELNLESIEVRACTSMGSVLRRPQCEESLPLAEIISCSSTEGCQTYNPVTEETIVDPEPYEGLPYISITPQEPLSPDGNYNIVFSNVKNPRLAVDYQYNLSIETPNNVCAEDWRTALGHCAIGTWFVPIDIDSN
jgi:hypothetical protein